MPMKINDLKQLICVFRRQFYHVYRKANLFAAGLLIMLLTNKKGDGPAIAFFYIFYLSYKRLSELYRL